MREKATDPASRFKMANSIYNINKGINKPIEFRGLKAQYIWWLAAGMIALMILFAILYITGVNAFVCVGLVMGSGFWWIRYVYRISARYGEHGLMKKIAKRRIPPSVKSYSSKIFLQLKSKIEK